MTMVTEATYVSIKPLEIGGRTVIPAFGLSADISNWGIRPVGRNGEQNYRAFPTLAQLRHAFETDETIKKNIHNNRYKGEDTATFLRDGKEAVVMPEKVYCDKESGLWVAEGGKVTKVELPPDGWGMEYDKPTGFPSRTSKRREDATRVFGDDASYFWKATNGCLYAVWRDFRWRGEGGPFDVGAGWQPGDGRDGVGSRSVQGSVVSGEYARGRKELLNEMRTAFSEMSLEDFQRRYGLGKTP